MKPISIWKNIYKKNLDAWFRHLRKISLFINILFLVNLCSVPKNVEFDPKEKTLANIFPKNIPTVLYSYHIQKETIFIDRDDSNTKYRYRLSVEDPEAIAMETEKIFQTQKFSPIRAKRTRFSEEVTAEEEEDYLSVDGSTFFLKYLDRKLVPHTLEKYGASQLLVARINYSITENKKVKDQSNLNVSLIALVYNKKKELVYATEKKKTVLTYLPDDTVTVASVMGDLFNASVKGEVKINVNKHCRPQLQKMVGELWEEILR